MRLPDSDASPSFPFGSAAEPLFTQTLTATNGDDASRSTIESARCASTSAAVSRTSTRGRSVRRTSAPLRHDDGGPAGFDQILPRRLAHVLGRDRIERAEVLLERLDPARVHERLNQGSADVERALEAHQEAVFNVALGVGQPL